MLLVVSSCIFLCSCIDIINTGLKLHNPADAIGKMRRKTFQLSRQPTCLLKSLQSFFFTSCPSFQMLLVVCFIGTLSNIKSIMTEFTPFQDNPIKLKKKIRITCVGSNSIFHIARIIDAKVLKSSYALRF